jgi:hypothetical protein
MNACSSMRLIESAASFDDKFLLIVGLPAQDAPG